MPVTTRSAARSEQPSERVTLPRANTPRRPLETRQGNAVVSRSEETESSSNDDRNANGNPLAAGYTISCCQSRRCMTCPKLQTQLNFSSTVTQKSEQTINHSQGNINCHSQNLIYLLTCSNCNLQYVGETTLPLHKRINIHRVAKTGCQHIIDHFKTSCKGSGFSIQIIEKFVGTGYNNNKVDADARNKRLEREDFWIKKLRTLFPYGLNERTKNHSGNGPVGLLFPPIPRKGLRHFRSRNNRNSNNCNSSLENFFTSINNIIHTDLKTAFQNIRIILNKTKKKLLKEIANAILQMNDIVNYKHEREQVYLFILDIIDTKLYKPRDPSFTKSNRVAPNNICNVKFVNKGMELIRLPSILNDPEVIQHLPSKDLQTKENIPVVTYNLGNTIRNKIFNYKQTVESIFINDNNSVCTGACNCHSSNFVDKDHGHVITGDLKIIKNSKLRKLFTKRPNFREPQPMNLKKCLEAVNFSIDDCIERLSKKTKLPPNSFHNWKNHIINKVKLKIDSLGYQQHNRSKQVLSQTEVLEELNNLQDQYVIVPIDKASNNFAFICKQFYISKIIDELGLSDGPSDTYKKVDVEKSKIITDNITFNKKFGLDTSESQKELPLMYWIPKMHKSPIGSRFIIASKKCSNKPLSEAVSNIFKMIFAHVRSFNNKSRFYSGFNKFWVVENSFPVIEKLNHINVKNNAKSISTFDFSTLYTKLPHKLLIEVLGNIIDFVFKSIGMLGK